MKKKPEQEDFYEYAAMQVLVQPLIEECLAQIDEYNEKSYEYSERIMKRIRGIFRRQRMLEQAKAAVLWSKRAAVGFMILIALAFVACATIEPLREKIANAFLTWYDEYVDIEFEKTSGEGIPKDITYIPEGSTLVEKKELNGFKILWYQDKNGNDLDFSRSPNHINTADSTSYDSEHYNIQSITINEMNCILMMPTDDSHDQYIMITWEDEGYVYFVGSCLSLDEVIKMVESVQ